MNDILSAFCFEIDSFTGTDLARIVEESVRFAPRQVRCSEFAKKPTSYSAEALKSLARAPRVDMLELRTETKGGEYFLFATLSKWGFQVLYWKTSSENVPPLDFFAKLTQNEGFTAGYASLSDYVFWQSTELVNTYEVYGRSTAGLPKRIEPDTGMEMIDISPNPGRRVAFDFMWLQAAWRMWFGPKSFRFLDPQRLLSFPCHRRSVLPGGVIFIELFEDPAATEQNQAAHQAFRDWMKLDELQTRAGTFVGDQADGAAKIEKGQFPNGGVWLLTQWFDEAGTLMRRSRAAYKKSVALDAHCQPVWYSEKLPPRD